MTKFFNIYLKLITILLCHHVLTINAAKTRIVGGVPTTINGQNAFIVSLRGTKGQFLCGGSLVDKNYVVTAAHCVYGLQASDLNVHGGVTYLSQVGKQSSVEKISIPQAYNKTNFHMDVAVLKLSKPMEGPTVATIGLCAHKLYIGDPVVVSGWGVTIEGSPTVSNQLMTTAVRLTSTIECNVKYYQLLTNTMMCAAVTGGTRDSCSGDSGGPLVHEGELCGIVSFGYGCAHEEHPGVYTNIHAVKEFINTNMN